MPLYAQNGSLGAQGGAPYPLPLNAYFVNRTDSLLKQILVTYLAGCVKVKFTVIWIPAHGIMVGSTLQPLSRLY